MIAYSPFNSDEKTILEFMSVGNILFDTMFFRSSYTPYVLNFVLGHPSNNLILKLTDTIDAKDLLASFEQKIYEATTNESRLYLLCEIAAHIGYPSVKYIIERLHPKVTCNIENLDEEQCNLTIENNITSLMNKYDIPNKYRPYSLIDQTHFEIRFNKKSKLYQSRPVCDFSSANNNALTVSWERECEIKDRILTHYRGKYINVRTKENIQRLVDTSGNLLSNTIRIIDCMSDIYNISTDKIIAILSKFEMAKTTNIYNNKHSFLYNETLLEFITKIYANAKGKKVALLYLALKEIGALTIITKTEFYRAFLSLFGRESELPSFRKGVDKYLNKQGKPNDDEWITNTIKRDEVTPVIERLSSQK